MRPEWPETPAWRGPADANQARLALIGSPVYHELSRLGGAISAMIAVFWLELPFYFLIRATEELQQFKYPHENYDVRFLGLQTSAALTESGLKASIGGAEAHCVDRLVIGFMAENFEPNFSENLMERRVDPPIEEVFRAANRFLHQLRARLRSAYMERVTPHNTPWQLEYYDNAMTPIAQERGWPKVAAGTPEDDWRMATVLSSEDWLAAATPKGRGPLLQWEMFLLEARRNLYSPVYAVVLADAAMELLANGAVRIIAQVTKQDVPTRTMQNGDVVEEKRPQKLFHTGLKKLVGISMRDNNVLWDAMVDVSQLRNDILHDGRFKAGETRATPENLDRLIRNLWQVVEIVAKYLPKELQIERANNPGFNLQLPAEDISTNKGAMLHWRPLP